MPLLNFCPNGHVAEFPDLDGIPFPSMMARRGEACYCEWCSKRFIYEVHSDDLQAPLVLIAPPVTELCNLGHVHKIEGAVYEIPLVLKEQRKS